MCRTVHAVLQTVICGIQMLVRVFMTAILMIENVFRMLLQTIYNFISFVLQMISLIPICLVFMLSSRLKCFMCGGGGPCPVNRGGACDCIMSGLAFIILFFIFRATGVLDKIFYSLGYAKAKPVAEVRFVPTPGDITECSRNDTDTNYTLTTSVPVSNVTNITAFAETETMTETETETETESETESETETPTPTTEPYFGNGTNSTVPNLRLGEDDYYTLISPKPIPELQELDYSDTPKDKWTTVLYYLM